MRVSRNVNRIHRPGIQPRVIHTGRNRPRRGIKILHLLRHIAEFTNVLSKLNRILHPAARVGGHQIGNNILFLSGLLVHLIKKADKLAVYPVPGLSHLRENIVRDMLRRHTQLSADVVLTEFSQKSPVPVRQQIIKAESGPHKYFFDARKTAQFFQQRQIITVVNLQIRTGFREKTAPVFASAVSHLLLAGGRAELRGRSPDIINVTLEIRFPQHLLCLLQDRLMAAHLDDAALMESQRAEIAVPVASPVGGQAETDLAQSRDPSLRIVHRMPGPHVGKRVNIIHFLHGKRLCRRVLHNKGPSAVSFIETLRLEGIRVGVLQREALRIGLPACGGRLAHSLVVRQTDRVKNILFVPRFIDRAVDKSDIPHIQPRSQGVRDLHDAALPHPIRDEIRTGIQQDRPAHLVRPVVIVGHPPEACLQTTENHRLLLESPADQIPVDHHRIIRPLSHHSAGRKGVPAPVLFVDRVVVHHRIHVSRRDQKTQPGLSQNRHTPGIPPVRLADHAH